MCAVLLGSVTPSNLSEEAFSQQLSISFPEAEKSQVIKYSASLTKAMQEGVKTPKKSLKKAALEMKMQNARKVLEKRVIEEKKEIIRGAYAQYQNAFSANLPLMVLGREELRKSKDELRNFGILSNKKTNCPNKLIDLLPEVKRGSIFADKPWSKINNIAFIFGSIHAKKTFYVQINPSENLEEILRNKRGELTMLAKEIAMLYASGYRQVASEEQMQKCGPTFVCLDHAKASTITFQELIEEVTKIHTISQVQAMFLPCLE